MTGPAIVNEGLMQMLLEDECHESIGKKDDVFSSFLICKE
jgi:hypothetical protein